MRRFNFGFGRVQAVLTIGALVAVALVAPMPSAQADTAPPPGEPATYSVDALPTVQQDGVAWAQVIIGNTVYVGGSFQNARPPGAAAGTADIPRHNMLAYDLTTGNLITSFAPDFNGQILGLAASPDGSRVYAVGDFTQVSGLPRYRIVALDAVTGTPLTTFVPGADFRVHSVVATADVVYIGGSFSAIGSNSRTRLAALSAANGSLLPWNPSASGGGNAVTALTLTPDGSKLIVGGNFASLNGQAATGLGAIDTTTGARVPWAAGDVIKNVGDGAAISSLVTDGSTVYGSGYATHADPQFPKGNLEASFAADANTGAITWVNSCHGDTYDVMAQSGVLYAVGHPHDCRDIGGFPQRATDAYHRAIAVTTAATGTSGHDVNTSEGYPDWYGTPSPSLLNWFPNLKEGTITGQSQAAWTIAGNGDYVSLAGEFPKVNGVAQQGIVRFARSGLAPNKWGAQLSGPNYTPALVSPAAGVVHGSILANYDYDNSTLTYRVWRQGLADPIKTVTVNSQFYNQPMIVFDDTGLTPGQSYNYRVSATDPFGNIVTGDWTPITVAATGSLSLYEQTVMNDGPVGYWRLDEPSSTNAVNDAVGRNPAKTAGAVTRGAAGAIAGDPDTATTFLGTQASHTYNPVALVDQQRFGVEAWFKTTTTKGGRIVGFGDGQNSDSGRSDRHIYMLDNGKLDFGVMAGSAKTITSPNAYNDGKYHHVVGQLTNNGMQLYVDGSLVASDPAVTAVNEHGGYWRAGGDSLAGWPNRPTSDYFAGTIDEFAVYQLPLTAAQIKAHYLIGTTGQDTNQPPVASFTAGANGLSVTVDASASHDPDGTISSYQWDFGDGLGAIGATSSHTYANAGSYVIHLTVTDDRGDATSTTQTVVVTAGQTTPPVQPTQPAQPGQPTQPGQSGKAAPEQIYKTKALKIAKNKIAKFKIASFTSKYNVKKFRVRVEVLTGGKQGKIQLRLPKRAWHTFTVKKARSDKATLKFTVTKDGRLEVRNLSNRKLKVRLFIDKVWIAGSALPLTLH